jgi:carboxyl-terminal processing protease
MGKNRARDLSGAGFVFHCGYARVGRAMTRILPFGARLRQFWCAVLLAVSPLALSRAQDESAPASEMQPPGANGSAAKDDSIYSCLSIFTKVLQLVRQDYVDEDKVDYKALTYNALRGMLSGLDPHSQFMEPDSFKDMQDDTRSRYDGLGLVVSAKDGILIIVSAMEDTPASKAGLMSGDQILKINGTSTEKMQLSDATTALKGKPGESITLQILRPASKEVRDFSMVRTEIKVDSVKEAHLIDPALTGSYKVGYVRIIQFNEPTADDLSHALDDLQKQGMQALVLDLRNNPGGLLNSAVDVCGQFLPPNTMVVYTEGRTPSTVHRYTTPYNSKPRGDFPVAVLINSGSASGAEIVAGALKDLNRAILVGETTFGKGSVQSVIQLPDGSAVRLTVAKYFTPSKQVIHQHGVTPTIRATLTLEQERALAVRRNSMDQGDEPKGPIDDTGDPQLERSLDALKGMLIYKQQLASRKEGEKRS